MAEGSYSIREEDGFVRMELKGRINGEILHKLIAELKEAIEQSKSDRVLFDIREVNVNISMSLQASSIGALWMLRGLKKAAFLFSSQEILDALLASVRSIHLEDKFRPFEQETAAIAWLKEE